MAQACKFALEPNTGRIIRSRLDRIKRRPALWVCVVMVIRVIAGATLIIPAGSRIYEPRPIQLPYALIDSHFREWLCTQLAPPFIVDDLFVVVSSNVYSCVVVETTWDIKLTQVTMHV